MYIHFVQAETMPEALAMAVSDLDFFGDTVDCPAYGTRCAEMGVMIHVGNPTKEPRISGVMPGGPRELEQYRLEMLDGILDHRIGRGWDYTYHDRYSAQLRNVEEELRRDPHTRRACISLRRPDDITLSDPPCLQQIQFLIRGGALDMVVMFRSNDAIKAAAMNMFALICLQERVAKDLGAPVGTYTHIAASFHAYERDWETLELVSSRVMCNEIPAYRYRGDWEELMEEERPGILAMAEELKQ